jgi:hypothetical protein
MNEQKSLLLEIAEAIDRRLRQHTPRDEGPPPEARRPRWLRWLGRQMVPNVGTLLMVVVLLLTVPSLAAPLRAPAATSTSTISYQGRLADSSGNPLTGKYNLEFRVYDVPTGGVPLWTEMWTGANAVDVSDGLFNVMLGSIDNTLASAIEGHDELYLGITVGTDSEMVPRVQLGSVPFSMQAMTVPDGSIDGKKLGASFGFNASALLNYVVRGVPSTPDMELNSGIEWTNWNVRSIVGNTAVAVVVYARTADDAQGSYAAFREPGAPEDIGQQVIMASSLHRGQYKGFSQYTVLCDSNQNIRYRAEDYGTAPIEAQFWIVGWYEPANH